YTGVPRIWGVSLLDDQQIAGLIMWIPGSMVFFGVMAVVFIRWLNRGDQTPVYERT
ncbi:MAG TPA: cytochrome c oxidase assembly protein, partial [Roseiflexaceae bacterium]|nr:cytochrome c oxidase assembly protein [Roseiflexaceae bacterium]